jgi:hypothetical protein
MRNPGKTWSSFVLAALLGSLIAGARAQTSGGWKAGVAKADITPKEPIWMAGFGSRNHPSEGVRQDLYVKALALQDETGKISVLETVDLVDTKRELWDVVAERCEKKFGLTRDRMVFNESHSHSGPVVSRLLIPSYYPLDATQEAVVRRYTAEFLDKAVEVVGLAIGNLAPATLEFDQGFAGIAVNRRRVRQRSLPGPVDQDVPVLAVRDAEGKLRAIVVGYSCHATALMDYQISGDWPGYAQEEIEKAHPGATALFVQGCGADSNALPRRTVELARMYGQILAAAVEEVIGAKMTPLAGPLKTAFERVDVPFRTPPTRDELLRALKDGSDAERQRAQRLLKLLDRDGKFVDRYPYPVEVWQFGGGLKFIALGGEVVADYALRLKGQLGWDTTWVAGYSNDVFAYIPSLRVLKEGGYEGGDAMAGEPFPGPFGAAVEEIVVEKVMDLVKATNPDRSPGPGR